MAYFHRCPSRALGGRFRVDIGQLHCENPVAHVTAHQSFSFFGKMTGIAVIRIGDAPVMYMIGARECVM